jgi:endonuclease/exonuclease/phosphatase family metal-dependent hydrolase
MNLPIKYIFLSIFFIAISQHISCKSAKNYLSPQGPKFLGNYATDQPIYEDSIKVITFNIKFSRKIDQAIEEIKNINKLRNADIILLQEMDEVGTEKIAKTLKYNYIYYPATIHMENDKNFGNAILSKWPMENDKKILLPYEVAVGKTRRIAVASTVKIKNLNILVYSAHTATITLSEEKRMSQADYILKSISTEWNHIIVGGDFNTIFSQNVRDLEKIFHQNGFIMATGGAGPTVKKGFLNFTLDHIFTKGFQVHDTGVVEESQASDHLPLWVVLKPIL